MSWNITLRCPLKCAHCSVDAGDREAEQALSTEEAFDVIDQIRAAGKPVVFTGKSCLTGDWPFHDRDHPVRSDRS